jgi:hypothetical protein
MRFAELAQDYVSDACAVQNVEMVVLGRRECEAVCVSSAGVTVAVWRSTTHTEARGGTHRQLSDHLGEYSGTTFIVTLLQQTAGIFAPFWIEPPAHVFDLKSTFTEDFWTSYFVNGAQNDRLRTHLRFIVAWRNILPETYKYLRAPCIQSIPV